jgi:hypothetical protein
MTKLARPKMTFNLADPEAAPQPAAAAAQTNPVSAVRAKPEMAPPPATPTKIRPAAAVLKQIGTRIDAGAYRKLKAKAALEDVTVQEILARAINQYLGEA